MGSRNNRTTCYSFLSVFFVYCVILLNSLFVSCFNIDSFNYAAYGTQEESMFGFTVAVHKQGHNSGWILVGAPNGQSQYQRIQSGVVYKCRTDGDDPCVQVPFDRQGNQYFGGREMDQKSGQWFGATLSSSGNPLGGPVVACAPRYVWYSKEMNRRDPVGTCFVSDAGFEKFEEYSPCRTSNWGYHRQGSCQAGFSAAINSIGDRLFVGAPGSYYWQGQMYSIDAHASFNYTPGLLGTTYGAKGSVHQQSLETRPAVFQTREGVQQDDDSYLGYSTIVGDFLGNGEQGIAVGMPRGAELHGKVLLFTWNLTNYKNISSSQLGSYFGYSLAAADVDGDKKLDLIVGAPLHTEPNTEDKYDVGRVYVFYQGGGFTSFNKSSFLDGLHSKSRFGHSVAGLGDLNQDGFEDFVVGAPYDGENNRGAVYIFYGSAKGVLEKYGQVIYAEDMQSFNGIPVSTFGFSVTGGMDMDENDYPDMAVGAYLSNSAFFFRSRPVVRVEAFVRFRTDDRRIFFGRNIDIKGKNCNLPNGQRGTCTTIDFCVKYTGKGIPQQIRLDVQYLLDTRRTNIPRMAFLNKNTHTLNDTIIIVKDRDETCKTEQIYIKNDIRDKLTPLEAEVRYFMIEDSREAKYFGRTRNPQSELKPILDLNLPPSRKDSISIQKNCGHDDICIPNLHINITKNVDQYLLDSNTNLEFDIIVSNYGEDSFETTFELAYPEGVHYIKTEVEKEMQGILCSLRENRTIGCDIGNPLPANKIAKFRMIFSPFHKQGMAQTYEFEARVNSTNPEDKETLKDNYARVNIDIWVDSSLDLSGRSIPQEVYLQNTSQYTSEKIERESDIGPQVTHLYTLKNKGPATIYEAEMYFLWPWQTLAGDDLLYLLEQPHVPEGVKCDIPALANYKGYQLDYYTKPIWERLQIDASSHDRSYTHGTVTVHSGHNITAVTGGTKLPGGRPNIDKEIGGSGDSSLLFEKRYNASVTSTSATGSQSGAVGGGSWSTGEGQWVSGGSGHDSTGNINEAGKTVYTKQEWHTVYVNGKPVTRWTNVTTVKDATGKILNTFYKNVDADQIAAGGYQGPKPKIVYSSSGHANTTSGEENLSIGATIGSSTSGVEEQGFIQETSSSVSQQHTYHKASGTQQVNGGEQTSGKASGEYSGGFTKDNYHQTSGVQQASGTHYISGTKQSGKTQQVSGTQQISGGQQTSGVAFGSHPSGYSGGYSGETRYHEEHAYTVGGGIREGGAKPTISTTEAYDEEDYDDEDYDEEEIIRTGVNTAQGGQKVSFTNKVSSDVERENEERRRLYEERRQYEERIRQEQERRQYQQKTGAAAQNTITIDEQKRQYEERLKYEEERRKAEEERLRYEAELKRIEEARAAEEKARQEEYEKHIRLEEERRRQQGSEDQRRRQQVDEERRRQQQREEEIRRRQEDEERRRQYAAEDSRRIEEERRRQYTQTGASSGSGTWQQEGRGNVNWQQEHQRYGGSTSRSDLGERKRTGYYDAQGIYHDEKHTVSRVPGGVSVNHTWTVEGEASLEDLDKYNQKVGGQLNFGQAAAGGSNFRTQTIDLGMIGGASRGQQVSGGAQQWSGASGAGGARGSQESSGQHYFGSSGQRTSGGTFSGTLEGGIHEDTRYEDQWQRRSWSDGSSQTAGDNVATDRSDQSRRRGKRQVPEVDPVIDSLLKCKATRCFYVRCVVGTLKKDEFISIALRSRLNVRAIREMNTKQPIKLSSMMVSRISKLPYVGTPKDQVLHSHEIFTEIPAEGEELTAQPVPLWIILLSAIAGTLILLLVILLLYKCGFFKRKRPSSAPERQPLRTNGYHHGDEAL